MIEIVGVVLGGLLLPFGEAAAIVLIADWIEAKIRRRIVRVAGGVR